MISIKGLSKKFTSKDKQITAVDQLTLDIKKGDIFGVIGYSGAGKSTFVRLLNRLEEPSGGQVFINNREMTSLNANELRVARQNIGMIFQHFNLLQSKTIYENIAIPLILSKTPKEEIKERVRELLQFVGLEDKEKSYPNELSGGQKQRIGIARALATNPSILLCDEVTSALDPQTTESILELLKRVNEEYCITIVMITHEMNVIKKICHKVAVMEKGEIIEKGDVEKVFSQPQQASTKNFVKTIIDDSLPQKVKDLIRIEKDNRFLVLEFQEGLNEKINRWIRELDLNVNIVHASIHEIKKKTVGFLILQISGDKEKMKLATYEVQKNDLLIRELNK